MQKQKTVNIKQILDNDNFAHLMKKGLLLYNLNMHLQQHFPAEFKGLFQVVNMHNENIIIDVKNAGIRQALLFRQAELLQVTQQYSAEIKGLQFNVNPYLHALSSEKSA